jgi:hypothetical protein
MRSLAAWKVSLIVVSTVLLIACASEPTPPAPLLFEIDSAYQTNNNRLFYFVVRSTTDKQFMLDSYADIANKAFSDTPNPSLLGVFSVVPGTLQEYAVSLPAQGSLGLYFLLTEPSSQWKELLSLPLEEKYTIDIKENNQVNIKQNKGWFSWF